MPLYVCQRPLSFFLNGRVMVWDVVAQLLVKAVIASPREHLQGAAETGSPLRGGRGLPRGRHLAQALHMTRVLSPYPPSERWRGP